MSEGLQDIQSQKGGKLHLPFSVVSNKTQETTEKETSRDCKMCRGLNVDVEPQINELEGDGNVEMNVTVKPDLWGLYFETLEVRVPSLQSVFHVPVFVEAKGHPVFFTFAPDNPSPVFSFGSLKHGEGLSHHFTLRNRTCLPIKVAWTTYTIPSGSRHEAEFCLPDVRPKFWMGVDLHNPDDMKFCSIRLMEYFGNQECCTYKIEPSVVYLPPKGEANISATVRTDKCWFDVNHLGTDLLGTAVGLIYVDTNKDYEKGCFRPSGFDLEPLKLQLKTKVQISTLRPLNATREDLTFKVRATDVMLSPKEVYKVSKKLSFRNTGDSVAHVYFSTTEPFEIGGILQIDPSFARELSPCEALLKGGQIVEVRI
ncbi:hypothetical protein AAG570_009775 [Ranatra chinensis]|uniref:Uncharacterized protein n=1 Tax=Ranatra chinensis TaxID=642074 RepID=A0ABD0YQ13_9HEMI